MRARVRLNNSNCDRATSCVRDDEHMMVCVPRTNSFVHNRFALYGPHTYIYIYSGDFYSAQSLYNNAHLRVFECMCWNFIIDHLRRVIVEHFRPYVMMSRATYLLYTICIFVYSVLSCLSAGQCHSTRENR